MMNYRHSAYNLKTGEILNGPKSNNLKRAVALTNRINKKYFGCAAGTWRFSHDFGKRWEEEGFPTR